MTKEELAARIDGCEYGRELTDVEIALAKESGLVVVYGCSDDLMEMDGALTDEFDVYGGGNAYVCDLREIKAVWCPPEGGSWAYRTKIPHATFKVMEGEELYCTGIVFDIKDVRQQQTNADRIRDMGDDELAQFLCEFRSCDAETHPCNKCKAAPFCRQGHTGMIDWLQSPAEEG